MLISAMPMRKMLRVDGRLLALLVVTTLVLEPPVFSLEAKVEIFGFAFTNALAVFLLGLTFFLSAIAMSLVLYLLRMISFCMAYDSSPAPSFKVKQQ